MVSEIVIQLLASQVPTWSAISLVYYKMGRLEESLKTHIVRIMNGKGGS
jgi:hypothetical protein